MLEQRLRGRGTDSEESVQGRLKIAREELGYAGGFDAWIVNRTVEQAAGELYELIASGPEHCFYKRSNLNAKDGGCRSQPCSLPL